MSAILARSFYATIRLAFAWLTIFSVLTWHAAAGELATTAPQWHEVELSFTATRDTAHPYPDTDGWADFTHDDGTTIRRPMFWDGGRTFRVRFTSTEPSGTWHWTTSDRDGDPGWESRGGNPDTLPSTRSAFDPLCLRPGAPQAGIRPASRPGLFPTA